MLDINQVLYQSPGYMFWKDTDCNYLGANENLLRSAGLNQLEEIIGKNDFHMPWEIYAHKYRHDDEHILKSEKNLQFQELHKDISGQITLAIVNKKPLYASDGKIIGLMGTYTKLRLTETATPKAVLPQRQKTIAYLLTEGLSAKQIAIQLGISKRTVEYYIEIIKSKWGCQNKTGLIKMAITLGYSR